MKGYFVTGTGTNVGKTYVTAMLARHARIQGRRVFAFKPIETGCANHDGVLVGADQELLAEAAGGWQTGKLRGVYRFEPAVAPAVADRGIRLDPIKTALVVGASQSDFVLVEGAGGWRVPLNETQDTSDLARLCELPVIVVGHAGLGTINHCLLTIEAVEKTHQVAWLVLSQKPSDDLELTRTNVVQLIKRWSLRVIVVHADVSRGTLDQLTA